MTEKAGVEMAAPVGALREVTAVEDAAVMALAMLAVVAVMAPAMLVVVMAMAMLAVMAMAMASEMQQGQTVAKQTDVYLSTGAY